MKKILFSRQNVLSLGGAVYDKDRTAHLALLHTTAKRLSDNDQASRGRGVTVCNGAEVSQPVCDVINRSFECELALQRSKPKIN